MQVRFVKGIKPGRNTGYDMDEDDLYDMEQCRGIVVASAIFGNVLYSSISNYFTCQNLVVL